MMASLVEKFVSIPMFVGVRRKAGVGGWRWPGDGDMDGGSNASWREMRAWINSSLSLEASKACLRWRHIESSCLSSLVPGKTTRGIVTGGVTVWVATMSEVWSASE